MTSSCDLRAPFAHERFGVVSAGRLREQFSWRRIDEQIASGQLTRPRRGWYATPSADPAVVTAVRAGGLLTGPSLLRLAGVWATDEYVHIRLRQRQRAVLPNLRVHWDHSPPVVVSARAAFDAVENALHAIARSLPLDELVAAADSSIRLGVATLIEIESVWHDASTTAREALELIDPSAESGLESLFRVRVIRHGLQVIAQFQVPGRPWRHDFLIGRSLIVEIDGRMYHDNDAQFRADRRRDRILVAQGYTVVRLTYADIMYDWDRVLGEILAIVRSGRHLLDPATVSRSRARHRTA